MQALMRKALIVSGAALGFGLADPAAAWPRSGPVASPSALVAAQYFDGERVIRAPGQRVVVTPRGERVIIRRDRPGWRDRRGWDERVIVRRPGARSRTVIRRPDGSRVIIRRGPGGRTVIRER